MDLANEVERLVREGYIQKFVIRARQNPRGPVKLGFPQGRGRGYNTDCSHEGNPIAGNERGQPQQALAAALGQSNGGGDVQQVNAGPGPNIRGFINMISSGPSDGETCNARKARSRAVDPSKVVMKVSSVLEGPTISFGPADLGAVRQRHADALVISASTANFIVARIFADTASSADILFHEAYLQMGLSGQLTSMRIPLMGYAGETVILKGQITLPVTLGSGGRQASRMVDFLVVDTPSAYNVILGRPMLTNFEAVISITHLKMKFPMAEGVGEVQGDQFISRKCYQVAARNLKKGEKRKEMDEVEIQPFKKV